MSSITKPIESLESKNGFVFENGKSQSKPDNSSSLDITLPHSSLQVTTDQKIKMVTIPFPTTKPGEAIVRIAATGIYG
jgi:hypothetical protein